VYGFRRLRATYPFGWLRLTGEGAELGVTSLGTLPRRYPVPLQLQRNAISVVRKAGLLGAIVGFKTDSTTHYFWTMQPG
jgi:hypothetical protein